MFMQDLVGTLMALRDLMRASQCWCSEWALPLCALLAAELKSYFHAWKPKVDLVQNKLLSSLPCLDLSCTTSLQETRAR